MNAPIVIFAFNRVQPLRKLIMSLQKCSEAEKSDLFIFVDGPRDNNDKVKIKDIKDLVSSIDGFAKISYHFSEKNKGLGPSIISGVSQVIAKYGSVIVLEDDLVVQPNFLNFINKGLEKYLNDINVFSICGYSNKIKPSERYPYDSYFCTRSSSWGWATWADRWESVDWRLEAWENFTKYKQDFNKWGGSDCFGMLKDWRTGKNKSWAIRFCFSQFLQDKLSLFPVKSLVMNGGFDGNGTNCKKWSRFKYELMNENKTTFSYPLTTSIDPQLYKQAMKYNSLYLRAWSKIMYLLHR